MADESTQDPNSNDPTGVNRREFFLRLGVGSIAVATCGTALFAYQYLSPECSTSLRRW